MQQVARITIKNIPPFYKKRSGFYLSSHFLHANLPVVLPFHSIDRARCLLDQPNIIMILRYRLILHEQHVRCFIIYFTCFLLSSVDDVRVT